MQTSQIRYFLAVCETLNFTRAAELCHVSQPSLTRAIKALEIELGGDLFARHSRNVALTALGRTVLPRLKRAHEEMRAARQYTRLAGANSHRQISLGLEPGFDVGPLLIGCEPADRSRGCALDRNGSEQLSLRIERGASDHLRARVVAGEIDLAVHATSGDPEPGLVALGEVPFVAHVSACHAMAKQSAPSLEDLARLPCLLAADAAILEPAHAAALERFAVRMIFGCDARPEIATLVRAGHGITLEPRTSRVPYGLTARELGAPGFSRRLGLSIGPGAGNTGAIVGRLKAHISGASLTAA